MGNCAEPQIEAGFDLAEYRRALSRFATGVAVITTTCDAGRAWTGVTINSFTSVSLEPPLALWCLARGSSSYERFATCRHVAVNVLAREHSLVSRRFASRGDRFADAAWWDHGHTGSPLLRAALAVFECEVVARHDAGDHVIFVGRVLHYRCAEGDPLVFHSGAYWHAGEAA